MATASIIFSKPTGDSSVINANFVSQEVANGASSTSCPADYNQVTIVPIGGDVWVAFSANTPDPSTTSSRYPLVANVPATFKISAGTKIGIIDRT